MPVNKWDPGPKYSKTRHTPTGGDIAASRRHPMSALFGYPAPPRRTVQQAEKFAPFSCLRRIFIHCLQARTHAMVWHSIHV